MTTLMLLLRNLKRQLRILLGQQLYQTIQVNCPTERLGSEYGGWIICPLRLSQTSTIYSFGVGEDNSFERELIEKYRVEIHAFDPTPRSIEWVRKQDPPEQFILHPYGIAHYDGEALFYPPQNPAHISHTMLSRPATREKAIRVPVLRLKTIMEQLSHNDLDVLKMDIEGAEYEVIPDILRSKVAIRQILIEFHHGFLDGGIRKTNQAISRLNRAGYRIFAISKKGDEYSFIKS